MGVAIIGVLHAGTAQAAGLPKITLLSHIGRYRPSETTLMTPAGLPVGGALQRAIDNNPMPTYRGEWVVDLSTHDTHTYCDWAPGPDTLVDACTYTTGGAPNLDGTKYALTPETVINPIGKNPQGGVIGVMTYEQGHVVDAAYLTDGERSRLMHLFGDSGGSANWWQGETQFAAGDLSVDPAGEEFSQVYWTCASRRYVQTALDVGVPNVSIATGRHVCGLIAQMLRH